MNAFPSFQGKVWGMQPLIIWTVVQEQSTENSFDEILTELKIPENENLCNA